MAEADLARLDPAVNGAVPFVRCTTFGQPEDSRTLVVFDGKQLSRLGIADLSTVDAFDHVATRSIECLQRITALLEDQQLDPLRSWSTSEPMPSVQSRTGLVRKSRNSGTSPPP